ncbi:MAG: competence/damage-inducible protein A [Leptolyngbyaceae bacterium]|nr:competence/damage-inducible protein A [Leptolyngbyaceae bacterium]
MDRSAEVICVGTELLLGDILNSNAQYLAQQLATLGIPHYYQTVVGDNPQRLKAAIAIASDRSQLLIFTGGLGPTPDDLTTETLADFFGEPLVERPEIIADILEKFAHRGRTMTPSNRKQALAPVSSQILANPLGSAPGIIWQPRPNLTILTFPGVPKEMHAMWEQIAIPYLKAQGWVQQTIYSRTLRHWGVSESALAERVSEFFDLTNPTVAPYASKGEVRLRISAQAPSKAEALALIAPVEAQLRQRIGVDCYGSDDDTLSSVVGQLLHQHQHTVAVAESCTGGGVGQALTAIPGSSSYFFGGVMAYSNAVKESLLNVSPADMAEHGAVSHIVAQQMAVGVRDRLQTTWGISITGIAGPDGGTETKPVGLVYIGLAGPDGYLDSQEHRFAAYRGREWVRWLSTCTALDQLRRYLLNVLR